MDHISPNSKTRTNQIILNQTPSPITFQKKFLNIQNNFPGHHHIYTDGSKKGMKIGCASKTKNC